MNCKKCYFGCEGNEVKHRFPNYLSSRIDTYERFQAWKNILSDEVKAKGDRYIYQCVRLCALHFPKKYRTPDFKLSRNAIPVQEPPYMAEEETRTPSSNNNIDVSEKIVPRVENGKIYIDIDTQEQNAYEDLQVLDLDDAEDILTHKPDIIEPGDAEEILTHVCRICLATGCKMYPMKQYNLEQTYLLLTGITSEDYESKMPQTLCFECAKRIQNFTEFSSKSLKALSLLVNLIEKDMLTMDTIKSVDRVKNMLTSKLTCTNIKPDYFNIEVKEEEIEFDEYNEYEYITVEDLTSAENYGNEIKNDIEFKVKTECEIIYEDDTKIDPNQIKHSGENRHPTESGHPSDNGHPTKNIHLSGNRYMCKKRLPNKIKTESRYDLHSKRKRKIIRKPEIVSHDMFIGKNIASKEQIKIENIKEIHKHQDIQPVAKLFDCELCQMRFDTDTKKNQHVWHTHLGVPHVKKKSSGP